MYDKISTLRFHALAPMYYRGAQAALVVYDITDSDSFRRAKLWVRELRQANSNQTVIGLTGAKSDLAATGRKVDTREAADYAEENGLIFMETSAKKGDNVAEIFLAIAKQVAANMPGHKGGINPGLPKEKPPSTGCCNGDKKS